MQRVLLSTLVLAVALSACGGDSGTNDEGSDAEASGDVETTLADEGDGDSEAEDPSIRLDEVCETGIDVASTATGIAFAPDESSSACQVFDADTAATVQIAVQARLDFEGNECDVIASGSIPDAYGDTGVIIDTAAGPAFSGEQSDIVQVIGCDDAYLYRVQVSSVDDPSSVATQIYEAVASA